jgi:hypothetical protein
MLNLIVLCACDAVAVSEIAFILVVGHLLALHDGYGFGWIDELMLRSCHQYCEESERGNRSCSGQHLAHGFFLLGGLNWAA